MTELTAAFGLAAAWMPRFLTATALTLALAAVARFLSV